MIHATGAIPGRATVDAHRTRNGQFLLIGSQKFTLMKSVSESLSALIPAVQEAERVLDNGKGDSYHLICTF